MTHRTSSLYHVYFVSVTGIVWDIGIL